jgi:catechol 2,3-dioxygenase-like lactoylglutathione lyase family enzyme
MFTPTNVFSSFSVDDLAAAKTFYGEILGLTVVDGEMGTLKITVPGGAELFVYPKEGHQPASYTMLNFVVDNVEAAVDQLNELGVRTKIYDDSGQEGALGTDAKGIMRGHGPDIAWFKDPAGNVLSVMNA